MYNESKVSLNYGQLAIDLHSWEMKIEMTLDKLNNVSQPQNFINGSEEF